MAATVADTRAKVMQAIGRKIVSSPKGEQYGGGMHPGASKCFLICFVLVIAVLAGCARSSPRSFLPQGSVLLLPPRDVMQDGKFHEKGADSGAKLMQDLRSGFESHGWAAIVTDNKKFSHRAIATERDALAEAKRLNARYVLQVVLGEFRDAAPMTFRKDFVTLQEAHLWNSESSQLIWSLSQPVVYEKNNLGSYYSLLDDISNYLVRSITE
jgi:hypothetical protein